MRSDLNFGAITENTIEGLFPSTRAPFRLRDYYAGGGIVGKDQSQIPTSGKISFSDFLKTKPGPASTAGSMNYDTAGTYTFTVPTYTTLDVKMSGGAGGSGSSCWDAGKVIGLGNAGGNGGSSTFGGMTAGGGVGGQGNLGGSNRIGIVPGPGAPGTASGGDTNTAGGGQAGAPQGASFFGNPTSYGGVGGAAGYSQKVYQTGEAGAPGSTITLVVGAGGTAGPALGNPGVAGSDGYVHISWT